MADAGADVHADVLAERGGEALGAVGRHVHVVGTALEEDRQPVCVVIYVCQGVEAVEEPLRVAVRVALGSTRDGSPMSRIPGRVQSGVATIAATRVTR